MVCPTRTLRPVRKSSVYLPDELKDALGELSQRWDRSEADLIRLAIDRLVRSATESPAPGFTVRVEPGPRLIGVGVGPSDPGLVTETAIATLRAADRVVAAATGADAIGRAEAVVRAVAPDVAIDRLPIEVGRVPGGDTRSASVAAAAEVVLGHLDRGELVAFVVLGDPNVYSVFPDIARYVTDARPGIPVETVPGIMAFQVLAADDGDGVGRSRRDALVGHAQRHERPRGDRSAAVGTPSWRGRVQGRTAAARARRRSRPCRPPRWCGRRRDARPPRRTGRVGGRCGRSTGQLPGHGRRAAGTECEGRPRPASTRESGLISFVGAGPGAADLLTLRAVERLGRADVVVWAGSLVSPAVMDHCRADVVRYDSSTMTLDEITAVYADHTGAVIVRLHSGDPSVYGAITEQIAWCIDHEVAFEIVPGVSSVAAAAAAAGRELTVPGVAQSVVLTRLAHRTAASVPDRESVAGFAALGPTMALFLSAARPQELQDELSALGSAYDDDTPAVIAHRVSWPDETLVDTTVGDLAPALERLGATTTVLVLVGEALALVADDRRRSHVYDASYAHSFRDAR